MNEKPFGAHPSGGGDRPEALVSFCLHKPQRSKYEGKGPETDLVVRSAGFQYGLSLVGSFPPLIINWQAQKQLWPGFFSFNVCWYFSNLIMLPREPDDL